MDINTIVQLINNKDDTKVSIENLLAITVLPLTVFKTESDLFNIIKELALLLKPTKEIDYKLIKNDLDYLMKQANFDYPKESSIVDTSYNIKNDNKNIKNKYKEDYSKYTTLLNFFASSLFYIQTDIHRTVKEGNEAFYQRISNGTNYLNSKLKIRVSNEYRDHIEKIERFIENEYIDATETIVANINNKAIKNQKAIYGEKIKTTIENTKKIDPIEKNDKVLENIKQDPISIKKDKITDSIDKKDTIQQNNKQETVFNEKYTANRQNVMGSMLAYYFLTEKERYTEESFKNLMSDTNVIFRDIRSKLGNDEVDYYLNLKFENNKLKYGNNKYTKLDQGFSTIRIVFLEKVANGYLKDKDISDINVQDNLRKLLSSCKMLMQENWNDIDITKDHITNIINKQILEKNNENELKRTKAKANLSADIEEKDKKYIDEPDNLRIYTKLSWYRALKDKATEYKNIVVDKTKKAMPAELKKILKMKP
jgi:hypothetical protein